MSKWYNKVVEDLGNIVDCIEYYEVELEDAREDCILTGRNLEKASAALPGITEYRYNQLQEIEAILEHLNILMRSERTKTYRKYLEHYNRQLSSRDVERYVDGEPAVLQMAQLCNQFALVRNKFLAIMKGLEAKQWQIGHITKLRTAGMEDIVVGR